MADKINDPQADFNKFRSEVRARLEKTSDHQRIVAFATRMALMALPGLTPVRTGDVAKGKEFLWYWPEEKRDRHLLAVCRALQVDVALTTDFSMIDNGVSAAYAAATAANATATYAYAVGATYAYIHTAAAGDAYAAARAAATGAAHAHAYARAYDDDGDDDGDIQAAVRFIRQELARLTAAKDAAAYLENSPALPFPDRQKRFLEHLRKRPTFDYWADWFRDRYDGKPIDPEILEKSVLLPEEIENQDPRAINRYLAEITAGERAEEKVKRVRAIFIGHGEAGKTSLIAALNGEDVQPESEKMTRGIAISEWNVPGTELMAHFWDFGGQVIAHATHQFFLRERCVYVLVLNARGVDSNPNQQAEYWLEFIRAFGNEAPVLLVGNKCDLAPVNVDIHRLTEKHRNIRGFYGLSAIQYRGKLKRQFGKFRDAFVEELAEIGKDERLYLSRNESAVIEQLRERSRATAFLEKAAFQETCAAQGIEDQERRRDFLNLLDQLGEVIYFEALQRAGFSEFLLNPRWLTHGVYELLYSDTLKEGKGVLRWNDVRAILRDQSIVDAYGNRLDYPEDRLGFLIKAMEQFRLCYPAKEDTWIIPDLLPSDQPDNLHFDTRGALWFDFKFESFLPRHLLGMFTVAHYRDIHGNLAWQHGVRLESRRWPNTRALVRADYQSRLLEVMVSGEQVDSYFAVLYDSILEILERMPRFAHTQRLHLAEDARTGGGGRLFPNEPPTADFGDMLAARADGEQVFRCRFGEYDLEKLLRSMQAKPIKNRPEPKTERRALKFWRERLGDLGSITSLLSVFSEPYDFTINPKQADGQIPTEEQDPTFEFRRKIEARLKEIGNPQLSAAFALRIALAELPILAHEAEEKGFLWYWSEEDREKYLFAVCRSLQMAWLGVIDPGSLSDGTHIVNIANVAVSDQAHAAMNAAQAAHPAADAASTASHSAAAANATDAMDADYFAALNAGNIFFTNNSLFDWVWREIGYLSQTQDANTYLIDSVSSRSNIALQEPFFFHLRQLPTFDYWADWLQDRYDGKPIDPEILRKSVLLPEEIANQDPRVINRYLKDLASGGKIHLPNARRLLAQGDYDAARARLLEIPETEHKTWQQIEAEFGFAFDFALDKEADAQRRRKLMGQMEWRRKVFAVLGTDAPFEETDAGEEGVREQADAKIDVEKPAGTPETESEERLPSQRQGEKLERDTLRLLRQLFQFDEEAEIDKLRKQKAGAQLGFDIKLEACLAANNENVRCCVECKSHEKELRFEDVVAKLLDAEANQARIDHWILIAPRAKLLGNRPDELVDKWNAEQKWPFTVQFWMADTEVWSLFGLAPEFYDDWIAEHPSDEPHPRDWSAEKREEIRQRWLGKLKPPLRLPQAWAEYVTDPDANGIFMENDDREDLRALREERRYIPPGALDESGSALSGDLEKAVRGWLSEGPRIGIVLGEFGDGKSAFTYMLTHGLLEEFRANPADGWLPARFPLRYFARPNTSAREFVRDRLEELGTDIREWNRAIVGKQRPLVILDGMDEMTKSLTNDAVGQAVNLLLDCCNRELEQIPKILITCRRTFFDELVQRRYVVGKLKNPAIFAIEPFSKDQVYEKLEALAGPAERPRLHALRRMHDPIGLARKALFFKMVSQTLAKPDADFSSETGIYRGYVEDCLARKSDYLESDGQDVYGDALVAGMLSVMEAIAMEMHLSDRDYFCLGRLKNETRIGLGREEIAKILWQDITKDEKAETDAVHRVGARSLLSRATGKVEDRDKEAWPVEFCHRSVREWFVARGMERALRTGREQAEKAVASVDINHEVLRFTVESMRTQTARDEHDYSRTLRELANLSRRDEHEALGEDEWKHRCRLGRTAITLLYKCSGKLDANDWRGMLLDGAQLPGADLTGKDFRGTSLRHANLNNAILDEADLRDADLTGVRLEEAGEITALSAPRSADEVFVAYRDGTIRRWSLDARSEQHPEVVFRLPEEAEMARNGPLKIAALPQAQPNPGLCLWDRDSVRFLDAEGKTYHQVGRFSLEKEYPAIAVGEKNMALLAGEQTGAQRAAFLFDFSPEGLPSRQAFPPDSYVECVALNDLVEGGALAGILTDGRAVVHAPGNGTEAKTRTTTLGNLPTPTCIAAYGAAYGSNELSGEFRVACGNRAGLVTAWRFTLEGSGECRDMEEIFCKEIHAGAVRALCFMDGETLLTGGADGRIHRVKLFDGQELPPPLALRLRCRGTRIAGLEGGKEREALRAAGGVVQ